MVAAQYIEVVTASEGDRKEKRRMVMAVEITLSQSPKTQLSAPTLCHSTCGPCTSSVSIAGKLVRNRLSAAALPPPPPPATPTY